MVTDAYPPPAGKATAIYPTVKVAVLNRDTSVTGVNEDIALCMDGVWLPYASLGTDWQIDWSGVHKANRTYPGDFRRGDNYLPYHQPVCLGQQAYEHLRVQGHRWHLANQHLDVDRRLSLPVRQQQPADRQSHHAGI